ncbi:MAG: PD40 domain-containing protein, partial [Acidobacteria bacterium]|nr:PD40 domain-containing protein [Acidobacteriota bacterium]
GYMAPEQIEGDVDIDARADLFAFGCLLYEMIGGKRAFGGESILDTLHAIARSEPQPVGEINPETPVDLERILKKCLAKDRDHRYQHADDVLVDLKNLAGEVEAGTARTVAEQAAGGAETAAAAAGIPWKVAAPAAVAIAAAAALGAWMLAASAPIDERIFRFEMALPEGVNYTILSWPTLAISPQGDRIAVAANGQIYTRAFDDAEAAPVRGTEGIALVPFFSPDGQSIGFWAAGELRKVSVGGGAAVKLTDLQSQPFGASWSDNFVYYALDGIWRVSGDGGEPEEVIPGAEDVFYHGPHLLPDGSILYTLSTSEDPTWDDGRIVVRRPDEEEPTVLVSGGRDARYLPTGHIVYALEDAVLARTFDLETREVGGAVPLLQGVAGGFDVSGASHFDVSATGDLVYIKGDMQQDPRTFVWRDGNGAKEVVAQANVAGRAWTLRLSPSGRYVAYRVDGSEGRNIWMLDLQRGIHSLFTPDGGARSFAWSPDGEYLYYSADSGTDTGTDMYRRPADMSVDAEEFITGPGNEFVRSISRDGEWLLYADTDVINTGAYDIKIVSLTEPGDPEPLFEREVQEVTASISPNGKWVVYVSGPQDDRRVFVQGFPDLGGVTQVSDGVGSEPLWAPDSSRLFYRHENDIMVVDVVSEEPFDISAPRLFLESVFGTDLGQNAGSYDISLDGERLLMVDWDDAETGGEGTVQVVLNWFKELNERVPTGR